MVDFFKKIIEVFNSLANGTANKHHKNMFYYTLIFGILSSLLLGTLMSVLLMCVGALFAELVYCFVPTQDINWDKYWFKVPDFKEFRSDIDGYISNPRHTFSGETFWYIAVAIFLFIFFRTLFLIF